MVDETTRLHARAYLCGEDLDPGELKAKPARPRAGRLVQTASAGREGNEAVFELLAAQTFQAESSGGLLAKKPEIDFLLRLAGTTQISRAIQKRRAVKGKPFLLIVADTKKVDADRELAPLELPRRALTRAELDRVEAAALLNVRRP